MARSVRLALGALCGLVFLVLYSGGHSAAQTPTPGPTEAPGLPAVTPAATPAAIIAEPVVVVGFGDGALGVFHLIAAALLFGLPSICFLLLLLAFRS